MKRHTIAILSLFATTVVLTGCNPTPESRYYIRTEQLPEGTVTNVMDRKLNTQLLFIAELNLKPPSINVLPLSRLDVTSVAVGPVGEDEVLVGFSEKDSGNEHRIAVSAPEQRLESILGNTDTDKDGKTDKRVLRFETDSGFIQYFDLDANGILDAQYGTSLENESTREARILIDQRWVAIVSEDVDFHDPTAIVTSKEEPLTNYQFQEGTWQVLATPE